ncbi:ATP-binding protein [Actinomycetospora straminea]|uniref:Histidine kinase/HSP90-like ATPase domain-containing protein n=1 Tax=Actinomycetospora straminea TaxID=663607 RepID=A0ABP9EWD5_9PSEU|nr:ATP-binding protein [Actinomycetospora straminea]MDD7932963.1 ATP-binding protein [Actinomycetospora straminea]
MSADGVHHRRLRVPATPECLEQVHALLADLLVDVDGVADADRTSFEIALAELVANVVEHAGAHGAVGLTVELGAGPADLTADLYDDGPPVDVDPGAAVLPDALAERGRGLALARAAVDDVSYALEAGTNHWSITRRRRA